MPLPSRSTSAGPPVALDTALLLCSFLLPAAKELGLNPKPRHFKPFEYFDHTSYLSYHHSRIALGLGNRERIDRLEVKWPLLGGETQRFKDLPIDPYIAIVEGEEKWK